MSESTTTFAAVPHAPPAGPPVLDALPAPIEAPPVETPVPRRGLLRRFRDLVGSVSEWLFGAAALVLGLAILAVIPVVQFLTLGYLLESSGRIARSGRLRDGFIGVRRAARLGSISLGSLLMWLPLWLLSSMAVSAQIIDPNGPIAQRWQAVLTTLTILFMLHVTAACFRGGKLRYFFSPFNMIWLARRLWRGGFYSEARDGVYDFVIALRLPYYFWLGMRGFAGAFLWLALPLTLLGQGHRHPLVGIVGALLLAFVVLYVPFLQMRFARDNRFRAFFEWRGVRADFRRAPVAFAFALLVMLALALPLYLLKIEMVPREIAFLETLVFLAFIFPARLLMGWAYGRATRRATPRHWFFRWTSRLLMVPTVAAYVLMVFFSQHIGWGGVSSLYDQHAFLLPTPFLEGRP
jgi:hypothetical protein